MFWRKIKMLKKKRTPKNKNSVASCRLASRNGAHLRNGHQSKRRPPAPPAGDNDNDAVQVAGYDYANPF
jgi:hypothetical protein